ncbi:MULTISPECIES: Rossmann-like domain-containing protein [unclassified Sedimentibacter]|uniref:Rossmann-like domain-containing protein n=1 Tax=unclassified Sedimentibacter TaxID=2649220 RepID=UPI0027E051FC|nr:DUF364 domain-containing protein [Sedimentibacter sp. MB35-C1]WMJ76272.1 DUF364 domain-containing protein [Sedimentibacter sp. MB35-C1]
MDLYTDLQNRFKKIVSDSNLDKEGIFVTTSALTPEEAIGITSRKDYPLLNGKEVLINAEFKGAIGQAFTDAPTVFRGNIQDIINMDLSDNRNKALFIASLNAVLKYLGLISNTVHCKNQEPELCGSEFVKNLKEKFGNVNIGLVGFQPAILDNIRKHFSVRVLDLDDNNIGKIKYDTMVEDSREKAHDVMNWADLLLVTGSTVTNGTITQFLSLDKPVFFFGTTIAGAAYLKDLERLCFYSA